MSSGARAPGLNWKAIRWHMIVAAAFRLVLERQDLSRGVGDPIQTAFVSRQGVSESEFGYLSPDGNPLDAASWKTVTIPLGKTVELRTPRRRGVASLV